jgi:hypothetical protein
MHVLHVVIFYFFFLLYVPLDIVLLQRQDVLSIILILTPLFFLLTSETKVILTNNPLLMIETIIPIIVVMVAVLVLIVCCSFVLVGFGQSCGCSFMVGRNICKRWRLIYGLMEWCRGAAWEVIELFQMHRGVYHVHARDRRSADISRSSWYSLPLGHNPASVTFGKADVWPLMRI